MLIFSICSYVADIATDLVVASKYFYDGDIWWFALTLAFILVPSVIMQLVSIAWYLEDDAELHWFDIIMHILQLGPVLRYGKALFYGMKDQRILSYSHIRDASMIRLLEAFFESAPQLVLQLYIMASQDDGDVVTAISACFSLISLSWAIGAYSKALRDVQLDRGSLSLGGVWVHCIWRIGMAMARVVALALFATVYKAWLFLAVFMHWLLMIGWLVSQKTSFCPQGACLEWTFDGLVAVVLIFCFINIKDGKTRHRVVPYYVLMFLENSILIALWYNNHHKDAWYNVPALMAVWGGFSIGLLFMFIYYRFFHPSVAIENRCKPRCSRLFPYVSYGQFSVETNSISASSDVVDGITHPNTDRRPSHQALLSSLTLIMKRHRFPPEISKPSSTDWYRAYVEEGHQSTQMTT